MTKDQESPKEANLPDEFSEEPLDKLEPEEEVKSSLNPESASRQLEVAKQDEANSPSLFEQLKDLADDLEHGPSPLLRRDDVIVPRDAHLEFVRQLIEYCLQEGEFGIQTEDALIDRLTSDGHQGDQTYMPMHRVKQRARVILGDATVQAENILSDARLLAARLLEETEEKIKSRYDEVDSEINVRLKTSREASTRSLVEARDELTSSRQKAVDILNRYMDKAEEDYQGYWERAEQTLMAALDKSDVTLAKVADIFDREIEAVQQDIETIDNILEELRINRPR